MEILQWMQRMQNTLGLIALEEALASAKDDDHESNSGDQAEKETNTEGASGRLLADSIIQMFASNKVESDIRYGQGREARRLNIERQLVTFLDEFGQVSASFSRSLTPFERLTVYETAELLGLTHSKQQDHIVVRKLKFDVGPINEDESHEDTLKRCTVLEELLTTALLELDAITGESVNREERKMLVVACQQLLHWLDSWKATLG